jgi:hypothetical protein
MHQLNKGLTTPASVGAETKIKFSGYLATSGNKDSDRKKRYQFDHDPVNNYP